MVGGVAVAAEFGGAGEGGGTGTDEGYAFAGVGRGGRRAGSSACGVKGVHGVALERGRSGWVCGCNG